MPTSIANGFKTRPPAALPLVFIQEDLESVERLLTERFAQYSGPFGPLVSHLRHYRGKRVRPVLLLLIGHACGRVGSAHHTLAAVMEMIHTATLVHDDVLDDATTRRHVRTVNAGWGNQVSILLGDLLFTHAFHLSSTLGDAEVCRWIGETTNRVCAGELRQLTERGNLSLSEQDYFSIIEGKTAALTECCGRLGAWQSGASTGVTNAMSDFGRNIGLAFQIADDVLDLCGDERTVGKTLGTDLGQQKLTLPLIRLLECLPTDESEEVREVIRTAGPAAENRLRPLLVETGALAYAQRRAESLADKARRSLEVLQAGPYRDALEHITQWSVQRDR